MQINEIKNTYKRKHKKRIGRGITRGKTSGRGEKGQGARAGHRIRPAERDLLSKFPKLRGVKNKIKKPKSVIIKFAVIEKKFAGEKEITKEMLKKHGLIENVHTSVKLLDSGELKTAFLVKKGIAVSAGAKKKIEAAGGSVE